MSIQLAQGICLLRFFNYLKICHLQDTSFCVLEVIFHRQKCVKYTTSYHYCIVGCNLICSIASNLDPEKYV